MFFLYGRRKPEDMLRKWRQSHGIEPPPSRSDVIRGNVCPNCHVEWPPTYEHCPTCGRPVSEKAKSLVTEQPRQTDELADLSSKLLDRVDRMEKELAAARAFQDIVESSPEGKSLMARILVMMKKKAQADRL